LVWELLFRNLIASFVAVQKGVTEVVVSNAVGSNIANILLVVGISAMVGKELKVTKSLIDLDLPLLAIGTVLLMGVVWDQQVTFGESLLLLTTYIVYLLYTVLHSDPEHPSEFTEVLPTRKKSNDHTSAHTNENKLYQNL
jgi:cation:H+ antiporter